MCPYLYSFRYLFFEFKKKSFPYPLFLKYFNGSLFKIHATRDITRNDVFIAVFFRAFTSLNLMFPFTFSIDTLHSALIELSVPANRAKKRIQHSSLHFSCPLIGQSDEIAREMKRHPDYFTPLASFDFQVSLSLSNIRRGCSSFHTLSEILSEFFYALFPPSSSHPEAFLDSK